MGHGGGERMHKEASADRDWLEGTVTLRIVWLWKPKRVPPGIVLWTLNRISFLKQPFLVLATTKSKPVFTIQCAGC